MKPARTKSRRGHIAEMIHKHLRLGHIVTVTYATGVIEVFKPQRPKEGAK